MLHLTLLTSKEQEMIHTAALNVLESVGCEIRDKRWLNELDKAGAKVENKSSRVFITDEDLINTSIETCGRKIKKLARNPKNDFVLGTNHPKTHTPEGMTHIIDLKTAKRRESLLSDVKEIAIICDSLTNVDAIISPIVPNDVPPPLQSIISMKVLLENSSKPVIPGGTALNRTLPYIFKMKQAIAGDRDITEYSLGVGVFATSPLKYSPEQLDLLWQSTEIGTPCSVGSAPQAGSTAPAYLAGMLTQFTAEVLMGLVMAQVKRPGLSQYIYVRTYLINPRMGSLNSSSPEVGLIQAAATQLFKEKYQIPVDSGWAVSDSHIVGSQATYEKSYIWLMSMLAGADMVSGISGLSSGLTASISQAVIDNEIIGYLRQGCSRILVDDMHLSIEMIKNIGIDGTFLTHPKTGKIIRQERWFPDLSTHDRHEIWEAAGSYGLVRTAGKKALEILESHEAEPLDSDLKKTLDKIVHKAKKQLI
ncbi:MAG: trimethylamine methyltransferase family protein [Promethearchaeota archaeon]